MKVLKNIRVEKSNGNYWVFTYSANKISWVLTEPYYVANEHDISQLSEALNKAYSASERDVKDRPKISKETSSLKRKIFDDPTSTVWSIIWTDKNTIKITPQEKHTKSGKQSFGYVDAKTGKIVLNASENFNKIAEIITSQ